MLSDDIAALAERLRRHEGDGCALHPVAIHTLVSVLRDMASQARALEGQPVPPPLRGELPEGVVRLRRSA